jgi:hypothetical protein
MRRLIAVGGSTSPVTCSVGGPGGCKSCHAFQFLVFGNDFDIENSFGLNDLR